MLGGVTSKIKCHVNAGGSLPCPCHWWCNPTWTLYFSNFRLEILKIHAAPIAKHGEMDYEAVVKLSDTFNGADLRNVCTEAGLFAIRAEREYIVQVSGHLPTTSSTDYPTDQLQVILQVRAVYSISSIWMSLKAFDGRIQHVAITYSIWR